MQAVDAIELEQPAPADPGTFRELVEQNSRKLFALAYRLTHDEQEAEDIVQETFLRAYRNLPRWRSRAQVSTWLYRIAANCAIDVQRRRRRWRMTALESEDGSPTLAATTPGPERATLSDEIDRRLEQALGDLTPRERTAFTLRHYEGLPVAEIAEIMELGLSAAKNHIFRAVRKLRRALEPLREVQG